MEPQLRVLYVVFFTLAMAAGRRAHGSARFEELTGRGGTTARLVCLAVPAFLLGWAVLPWSYALVLAALVFAGATLPQRGMALENWYDGLYLVARAVAVGLLVAPLLWWAGSMVWFLPAAVGGVAAGAYGLEKSVRPAHEGLGEMVTYALFGFALAVALLNIPG